MRSAMTVVSHKSINQIIKFWCDFLILNLDDPGNKEVSVPEQTEPEVVPANPEVAPVQEKTPTENQQVPVQEEDQSNEETIENIENFLESEKKSGMPKEKWVTVVFDEQGKQIPDKSMGKNEKSVYDLVRH